MTVRFGAAVIGVALLAIQPAAAEVVHATWGGGGAKNISDKVQRLFTTKTGITARVAEVPNTAGVIRSPAASQYSVVDVTFFEGVGMADLDLLEGFTDEELPEAKNLPPDTVVRNPKGQIVGVSTYFSYYGIAYNSNLATEKDFESWKNLADPKWKGKLSATRPVYSAAYDLTMLAKAAGGDAENIKPGIPFLQGLINNALTTYTSLAHINTLLGTGEVTAVPLYSTRIWQLNKQGMNNLKIVIPKEGALMLAYLAVAPKGAGNRKETISYLNYLITAEMQTALSADGGGIPTNRNAKLSAEFLASVGMSQEDFMKKMYQPDWRSVASHHEERVNMVEQMMAGGK